MQFLTHSAEETVALGQRIGACLKAGDVLAMSGTLAAGKTTLTKGIAQALGVQDTITSPTFCLISEYQGKDMPLYHMDVYRLDGTEDFRDTGAEELLYGNGVCVVEWSEKVRPALPAKAILLDITVQDDGTRSVRVENWHGAPLDGERSGE